MQFFREVPLRIQFQAPSERRGFLFRVAAGFAGDVDPESGMSVNLVDIDRWLADMQQSLQSRVFDLESEVHLASRLVYECRDFLKRSAQPHGVVLSSLRLSEERSGVFSWDLHVQEGFFNQECSYYLEFFEVGQFVDLLQLRFRWLCPSTCQEDLFAEGLKLLKDVRALSQADLAHTLSPFKGILQEDGNILEGISLEYRSQGFRLEL
jgi:hypothetical protein